MKRTLPLLALSLSLAVSAANAVYETPNTGKVYTLDDLAQIADAGVTKESDNTYRLVNDIEITVNDGFKLENNTVVRMGTGVIVRVYGPAEFAVTDTATICPDGDGVKPKGFHLYNMNPSARTIQHIRFEGASLSLGNEQGTVVENCTFIESNGELVKSSVAFSAASVNNAVRNCHFLHTAFSAISNGSNVAAGMVIEDNLIEDCSTQGRNYPYLNICPSGNNGGTIIRRNRIVGSGGTMAGAISFSNMLTMTGANEALIADNEMSDCRYGINAYGYQNTRIIGNKIVNCHYETNANNGGSGITVYSAANTEYPAKVYIQQNYINGNLWGITVIGASQVNMGHTDVADTDPEYNPGLNILKNNGNCGKAPAGASTAFDPSIPYDLYNNTPSTIYAQGNTWGGADQSAAEIEKRIFHKNDNASLGEVIFLPAGDTSGITLASDDAVAISVNPDGSFKVEGVATSTPVIVYDVTGALLWSGDASTTVNLNRRGLVIVKAGNTARRLAL
ncbi:MAG: hypothetical protein K2M98_02465 [Muribaculum sp.]|nr:hypothetical protein [Muribaculum sp.]